MLDRMDVLQLQTLTPTRAVAQTGSSPSRVARPFMWPDREATGGFIVRLRFEIALSMVIEC